MLLLLGCIPINKTSMQHTPIKISTSYISESVIQKFLSEDVPGQYKDLMPYSMLEEKMDTLLSYFEGELDLEDLKFIRDQHEKIPFSETNKNKRYRFSTYQEVVLDIFNHPEANFVLTNLIHFDNRKLDDKASVIRHDTINNAYEYTILPIIAPTNAMLMVQTSSRIFAEDEQAKNASMLLFYSNDKRLEKAILFYPKSFYYLRLKNVHATLDTIEKYDFHVESIEDGTHEILYKKTILNLE